MTSKPPKIIKSTVINSGLLLILLWYGSAVVWAEENNTVTNQETGAGSDNLAKVEIEQSTQVEQTNNNSTVNEISLNLNTGENQGNKNNGNSEINTGGIKSEVEVSNVGNINQSALGASETNETLVAVSNQQTGADSNNQAGININNRTLIATQNQQTVINQINIDGNTGNNQANKNTGDVEIETGNIVSEISVQTLGNISSIAGLGGCSICNQNYQLMVIHQQTGAGSENQTTIKIDKGTVIFQKNNQIVINKINGNLNTGENQANENTGDVTIHTGEIKLYTEILTAGNENLIVASEIIEYDPDDPQDPQNLPEIGGPDDPDDPDPQPLPVNNTNPPGDSGISPNNTSPNGGSSYPDTSVAGAVLGAILPLTGNSSTLAIWMWGLFLISMGRFVRLLSGRAPATAKSYV